MAITATVLQDAQVWADEAFPEGVQATQYQANIEALSIINELTPSNAVLQSTTITGSDNVYRKREVKLEWIENCSMAVTTTCTDSCLPGTGAASTNSATYFIPDCAVETTFEIDESTLTGTGATNGNRVTREKLLGENMLRADKIMCEQIQTTTLASLLTMMGRNQSTGVDSFFANSTGPNLSTVAAANWNVSDIITEVEMANDFNKFLMPYMIVGASLEKQRRKTFYNNSNGEGKGAYAQMTDGLPMYYGRQIPANDAYVINRGSLAFVSWNKYTPGGNGETGSGNIPYQVTMPSRNLPGLFWDVNIIKTCANGVVKWNFKFQGRTALFLNPASCNNANVTGLYRVTKGA